MHELARIKKEHFNHSPEPRDAALLDEAERLCRQVLDVAPRHFKALNLRGVILKKLGRYAEAIAAYQQVLELRPDYYPGWVNLGTSHALMGDLREAERCLRTSVEYAQADEKWAVYTWRNLASLQLYRGQTDEAAANIALAIECNREDRASFLIQARVLLDVDLDAAIDSARLADLMVEQAAPRVKRILAQAYLRSGKFAKAIANAQQAIELTDMPAINHLAIAAALAKLGQSEDAQAALDQADATWPGELRGTGSYIASANGGVLWFDTAEELDRLRTEAEAALSQHSSSPEVRSTEN
ncbi:MAG: tetratricopeptide repeat protein [Planctomycetes bacterium]|nr:tetratricopeptide repeat protein [Planctomycetota bacterium]